MYRQRKFWLNSRGLELCEPQVYYDKIVCIVTKYRLNKVELTNLLNDYRRLVAAIQQEIEVTNFILTDSVINYNSMLDSATQLYTNTRLLFKDLL